MQKKKTNKTITRSYENVGRKPKPPQEIRVQVHFSVKKKDLDAVGGKDAAKAIAAQAVLQVANLAENAG